VQCSRNSRHNLCRNNGSTECRDFVEQLNSRLTGLEGEFRDRVKSSVAFAALTEEATLAAVRTPSDQRRRDLAAVLRNGFTHSDAEVEEDLSLLHLLDGLNEPQILILMSYGNFQRTMNDPALRAFQAQHPGVFDVQEPSLSTGPDERRRWALHNHYIGELVARGLLEDSEGIVKSGRLRQVTITPLGRLLLGLVDRSVQPR
jgi:hypothetical protein